MTQGLFRGTRPKVFSTNPDDPAEGRTLVWAWTEWYERVEGEELGAVSFTSVASSGEELRKWLGEEGIDDWVEQDNEFGDNVRQEFLDEAPIFPQPVEHSEEPLFREQNPEEDVEHR